MAWLKPWEPHEEAASIEGTALPLPDKPSIAVLPFENFSGDASLDYLSDGISEDIITALARSPWLPALLQEPAFDAMREDAGFREITCRLRLPACGEP